MDNEKLIVGWFYKDTPLVDIKGHIIALAGHDENTGEYTACMEVNSDNHSEILREQMTVSIINDFTESGLYETSGYEITDWGCIHEKEIEMQKKLSAADYLSSAKEKAQNYAAEIYQKPDNYFFFLLRMGAMQNFSAENCALILSQNPDATTLKTFNQWKKDKRQVKKGEKGIDVIWKNESTLKYFDVSQTEGKPIEKEEKTPPSYSELKSVCKRAFGYDIDERNIKKSQSFSDFSKKKIFVNADLNDVEKVYEILYQLAFISVKVPKQIHNQSEDVKSIRAVRAESAAVAACSTLNIPVYRQFDYISEFQKQLTPQQLVKNLESIQITAKNISNEIDTSLSALRTENKNRELLKNMEETELEIKAREKQKEEQKIQEKDYYLESIRDDNEIDLDRERSRESLGFNDYDKYNEQLNQTVEAVYLMELSSSDDIDKEKIRENIKSGDYLKYLAVYESFLSVAGEKDFLSSLKNTPYYTNLKSAIAELKELHSVNIQRLNSYMSMTVPSHLVEKLFKLEMKLDLEKYRLTYFSTEEQKPLLKKSANVAEVINQIEKCTELDKELSLRKAANISKKETNVSVKPLKDKLDGARAKAQEINAARAEKKESEEKSFSKGR